MNDIEEKFEKKMTHRKKPERQVYMPPQLRSQNNEHKSDIDVFNKIETKKNKRPDMQRYVPRGKRSEQTFSSIEKSFDYGTPPIYPTRSISPANSICSVKSEFSGRNRYRNKGANYHRNTSHNRMQNPSMQLNERNVNYAENWNYPTPRSHPGNYRSDVSIHSKENYPYETVPRTKRNRNNKRQSYSRDNSCDSIRRKSCENLPHYNDVILNNYYETPKSRNFRFNGHNSYKYENYNYNKINGEHQSRQRQASHKKTEIIDKTPINKFICPDIKCKGCRLSPNKCKCFESNTPTYNNHMMNESIKSNRESEVITKSMGHHQNHVSNTFNQKQNEINKHGLCVTSTPASEKSSPLSKSSSKNSYPSSSCDSRKILSSTPKSDTNEDINQSFKCGYSWAYDTDDFNISSDITGVSTEYNSFPDEQSNNESSLISSENSFNSVQSQTYSSLPISTEDSILSKQSLSDNFANEPIENSYYNEQSHNDSSLLTEDDNQSLTQSPKSLSNNDSSLINSTDDSIKNEQLNNDSSLINSVEASLQEELSNNCSIPYCNDSDTKKADTTSKKSNSHRNKNSNKSQRKSDPGNFKTEPSVFPKHRKSEPSITNTTAPDVDDSWDNIYDDCGNLTSIKKPINSKKSKPKIDDSLTESSIYEECTDGNFDKFPHVVELFEFPATFATQDLMNIFRDYEDFYVIWVDDTHALGVFKSELSANCAMNMNHAFVKLRPLSHGITTSKSKAIRTVDARLPPKARPETSMSLARRLVTSSLGIKISVPVDVQRLEQQKIKHAKEERKLMKKQREEAWEGTLENLASS